ncbi:MAG: response regulator transcription factor, partial [Clostridia bacterium]|nr:response regulator transcription factor [Clostridia bacterium]
GKQALQLFEENKYDLVLLDLMLPEISGLEVCRAIREKSNVPVIMVTAKTEGIDKLIGFEYGADDYVTQPYDILELKARIRVILKRVMTTSQAQKKAEQAETFESESLKINFKNRSVIANGKEVDLTAKEFDLLSIFIKNPSQVFSRDKLLELGWGKDYPGDNRTVDVHIRKIREKIEEDDANPKIILTKWGVGYYFKG